MDTNLYSQLIDNDEAVLSSSHQRERVVWSLLLLIESLLIVRFIFEIFGVTPQGTITSFIYFITGYLLAPFTALFTLLTGGEAYQNWISIVAVIAYVVLAVVVVLLSGSRRPVFRIESAGGFGSRHNKYS